MSRAVVKSEVSLVRLHVFAVRNVVVSVENLQIDSSKNHYQSHGKYAWMVYYMKYAESMTSNTDMSTQQPQKMNTATSNLLSVTSFVNHLLD